MNNCIPVNEPLLNGNEKKYLCECIDTGWISSEGPFVKEFEQKMCATICRKYGIAVSNGTAALEVAVQALGIGEGDEVIMPTFTIISCAMAVTKAGGIPVLVDSDIDTWNMKESMKTEGTMERGLNTLITGQYSIMANLEVGVMTAKVLYMMNMGMYFTKENLRMAR